MRQTNLIKLYCSISDNILDIPYHGLPEDNLQSYLDDYCCRLCGAALLERLTLAIGHSLVADSKG